MAEAFGFIFAIAGLYSSCVEAFDQIRAARSFGRDYEILSTRFDVRKARFLQWGDGVGLLDDAEGGRHPALESPSLAPAVKRVLHCIEMLLTDAESFRSKYGLQEVPDDEATDNVASSDALISGRRRELFKASYTKFRAQVQKDQKETSLVRKTQWAIVGRNEFQALVSDLDSMIEDLYKLIPVQSAFRRLMVKEDIDALPEDLATLKLVQEACSVDPTTADIDQWLEAASVRVEATELGTQDHRHVSEWLAQLQSETTSEYRIDEFAGQELHHTDKYTPVQKSVLSSNTTSPISASMFHTGILLKRSTRNRWRYSRRFFSLDYTSSTLSYYHDRSSSTLRGSIPLALTAISVNAAARDITIDFGADLWFLKALNDGDFEVWKEALSKAVQNSAPSVSN
jgi:hypothetical protein